MGTDNNVKLTRRRGVAVNGEWLTRQMQMRAWTLSDFEAACDAAAPGDATGPSVATISQAVQGRRVDKASLEAMIRALEANPPIIPEEAIA